MSATAYLFDDPTPAVCPNPACSVYLPTRGHVESERAAMTAAPAAWVPRHYVRCHDCLSIVVIDRDPRTLTTFDPDGTRHDAACSLCGGRIDYMGEVRKPSAAWLTKSQTQCKCNELCIAARGPICTCGCGGLNHGAGLVAGYMTVHEAAGNIPRVTMPDSRKARAVAEAWRAALAAFDAAGYRALADRYGRREWLGPAEFSRFRRLQAIRRKAIEMTSQAGRLRVLAEGGAV